MEAHCGDVKRPRGARVAPAWLYMLSKSGDVSTSAVNVCALTSVRGLKIDLFLPVKRGRSLVCCRCGKQLRAVRALPPPAKTVAKKDSRACMRVRCALHAACGEGGHANVGHKSNTKLRWYTTIGAEFKRH
jgi:hypothetical protein